MCGIERAYAGEQVVGRLEIATQAGAPAIAQQRSDLRQLGGALDAGEHIRVLRANVGGALERGYGRGVVAFVQRGLAGGDCSLEQVVALALECAQAIDRSGILLQSGVVSSFQKQLIAGVGEVRNAGEFGGAPGGDVQFLLQR